MAQQMKMEAVKAVLECENLENVSLEEIYGFFLKDQNIKKFSPDGFCQIDPRDGSLVIYNSARGRRPHDNDAILLPSSVDEKPCPICNGNTTGVIDVAELSNGFTFINKNLFPIVYPLEKLEHYHLEESGYVDPQHRGKSSYGMHFLQWTSNNHNEDWQNMKFEDRLAVMQRLAALEKKLLFDSQNLMPPSKPNNTDKGTHGFVSIIKNYGALVGGSLAHGHQQIALTNIMPRRFYNNYRFFDRRREKFSTFMLRENTKALEIKDYGPAVLLVPYFMRRPYNMLLILKDVRKQYLHELNAEEMAAVVEGWHDAIRLTMSLMPKIGKVTAYNVTTNNGPGAGLYFEFLPYTQETGGYEHLGLWVCQASPEAVAENLRKELYEYIDDYAQKPSPS